MKVQEILTRNDYDRIKASGISYESICEFMDKFAKLCVEEALKNLPHVITSLANQAAYLKSLSEEFYKSNPDLSKDKQLVAKTIERIEAENPGMDYKQILTLAASKSRQTLSLKSQFKEQ